MCDTKLENVKLKKCIDCLIEKAESEFRKKGKYRQGYCKVCANNNIFSHNTNTNTNV